MGVNQHTFTDIFDFVNEVRELKINEGYILESYDVSSLFTNGPLDETIAILTEKAFRENWFNSTYNLNISKEGRACVAFVCGGTTFEAGVHVPKFWEFLLQ